MPIDFKSASKAFCQLNIFESLELNKFLNRTNVSFNRPNNE